MSSKNKSIKNKKNKFIIAIKDTILRGFYSPIGRLIPDEPYIKIMYLLRTRKKLDLDNPKTFNEKLQWLKIYDRKSIYTSMVDKYESKKYVAKIIGEDHIIPTIGVWEHFEDIDL